LIAGNMQQNNSNPTITPLLRWLTAFESVVVFISGAGLFFIPQVIGPLWPWALAPFNARFMGAIYFTALMAAGILAWRGRWSPARVVVPMIFAFTLIVLIISILYFNRFTNPLSTIFWFVLYIGIPVNAAYHLWLYRDLPPANAVPTPAWLRSLLLLQALVYGGYGIALLAAPTTFSAFWFWDIDDFHGRVYSVAFITPAVGSFLLARRGSALEFFTVGLTLVVGGIFSIAGAIILDATARRIDWGQPGTLLWMSMFPLLGGLGMLMLLRARQLASPAQPENT
jgi:hypothetical protein